MSDERRLPEGWSVELLVNYDQNGKITTDHNTDPTTAELQSADSAVVKYIDALGEDFRTVHGPFRDIDSIADAIRYEIMEDSPVR